MSESILEMEDGLQRANKRKMEDLRKNAQSPFLAWAIMLGLVALWHTHIGSVVPRPYLVHLHTLIVTIELTFVVG